MNQQEFAERHEPDWTRLEELLSSLPRFGAPRRGADTPDGIDEFPELHREICNHLALARSRGYAPALVDRLDRLVIRGHQQLYRAHGGAWARIASFIVRGFPATVRREWRFVLAATLLFYLPAGAVLTAVTLSPELAFAIEDSAKLEAIEEMYEPGIEKLGRERDSDDDMLMFGFYIRHNIGIGFRTFAGGVAFGIGSLLVVFYNGLYLGVVLGHLGNVGLGGQIYPFVIGHGAFELTAIVLSGAAGLKLGLSLLAPGRRSRGQALRLAASDGLGLIWGAFAMLVVAAFLEAFWSSSILFPPMVKYVVGAGFWILVTGWLLSGWRGAPAPDREAVVGR